MGRKGNKVLLSVMVASLFAIMAFAAVVSETNDAYEDIVPIYAEYPAPDDEGDLVEGTGDGEYKIIMYEGEDIVAYDDAGEFDIVAVAAVGIAAFGALIGVSLFMYVRRP
jgi:hypothetical protein